MHQRGAKNDAVHAEDQRIGSLVERHRPQNVPSRKAQLGGQQCDAGLYCLGNFPVVHYTALGSAQCVMIKWIRRAKVLVGGVL